MIESIQQQIIDLDDSSNYLNRELSWLAFNERVLEESMDESNPLLERLKFIAITSSNLDEFFMVRVASLKDQVKAGYLKPDDKSGLTPKEQLAAIESRAHDMVIKQYQILMHAILPSLKNEGIEFVRAKEMNEVQRDFTYTFFHDRVFPVLTPMAVDSSRPFPKLLNKTLNLAVHLEKVVKESSMDLFAVVQVPALLPRFIQLPSSNGKSVFILLEEVISYYMSRLFPGSHIRSVNTFRITRNADITLDEEGAEDLLEEIEKEIKKRQRGEAVRLELDTQTSEVVREFLKECLEIEEGDIYSISGPLDATFYMRFASLPGYEHLSHHPCNPQPPQDLIGETNLFEAISQKDILLHHPYESFEPVIHFIRTAAEDPNVLAIKQTLYRMSGKSPIVEALAKAAENGKQVMVLVELKARFDEENNIVWAKKLEEAGCHVIYGLVGLKTHGKITLVVRQEGESIKRYIHLGTGNYNDSTAKLYTDLGMFTSREEVGEDATNFFNHLSGYSDTPVLEKLTTAPSGMRKRFIELIQNEIDNSSPEKPGYIIAKMNSLTDKEVIKALFRASQAGVKVDLIVRGICCLRPGIPGVSENIRVYSIIGRFLEHSRIYYFQNGGNEQIYLSSADWMTRNLDRRVEILFPVMEDRLNKRIKEILTISLRDNVKSRELLSDGTYQRVAAQGIEWIESQMYFHQLACQVSEERVGMFGTIALKFD